jgi:hypothetical protein
VQGLAAGISSVAGPRPGLHADLVDLAAAMADAMAKDERISKLKSLENCIDGVSEENPKEFLYLLARLHPRLRERTQLIITEHLVPCSVCLNPKDFKRLVHFFRVFYEARTKGFDLEDAQ